VTARVADDCPVAPSDARDLPTLAELPAEVVKSYVVMGRE
jgi:hypothetical protein